MKERSREYTARSILAALVIGFMVMSLPGCGDDDDDEQAEVGATSHDNYVSIIPEIGSGVKMTFAWDGGYDITSGQPWGGVTSEAHSDGTVTLEAKAGRSGATGPASWFYNKAGHSAVCDTGCGATGWPDKLNFAFTGRLTINGTPYTIVVGQGHFSLENNWWFSGEGDWTAGSCSNRCILSPDGKYTISGGDSGQVYVQAR